MKVSVAEVEVGDMFSSLKAMPVAVLVALLEASTLVSFGSESTQMFIKIELSH